MLIDRDQKPSEYFSTQHLACGIALCLGYIFFCIIANYSKSWMHPEIANLLIPRYLKTGTGITVADLKEVSNTWASEHSPGPKYVSALFTVLNVKFRHWIFQWIPPHPSLSLSWLFTLFLTPLALFGLMRKLFNNKATALLGVCFYLASVNTMGSVAMLFQPAKPLSNFLFVLSLYLGAQLDWAYFKERHKQQTTFSALLFSSVLVGCFTDETFFSIFFALPLLFTDSFRYLKTRLAVGTPLFIFLAYITLFIPILGEPKSPAQHLYLGGAFHHFGIRPTFLTMIHLTKETLFPYATGWKGLLISFPILFFSIWCFFHLSTELKKLELRLFSVCLAFFCFQAFLLSRENTILGSSYCYGGIYPLLAALILAPLFTSISAEKNFMAPAVAIAIVLIGGYNFERINKRWIDQHQHIYSKMRPTNTKGFTSKRELTKESVVSVWKNKDSLMMEASLLPPNAYWLYTEIKQFAGK